MPKPIKERTIDDIFSLCIRERDDWTCQKSKIILRDGGLECAHIYGRAARCVRWYPGNAIALSHRWHVRYTNHPPDWRVFSEEWLGPEGVAALHDRFGQMIKYTPADRRDICHHYRSELKRMKEMRADGIVGALPLNSFD